MYSIIVPKSPTYMYLPLTLQSAPAARRTRAVSRWPLWHAHLTFKPTGMATCAGGCVNVMLIVISQKNFKHSNAPRSEHQLRLRTQYAQMHKAQTHTHTHTHTHTNTKARNTHTKHIQPEHTVKITAKGTKRKDRKQRRLIHQSGVHPLPSTALMRSGVRRLICNCC
jgi:hypothetical protein